MKQASGIGLGGIFFQVAVGMSLSTPEGGAPCMVNKLTRVSVSSLNKTHDLLRLELDILDEVMKAGEKGKLKKFDASVGDKQCHLLTSLVIENYETLKEKENLKVLKKQVPLLTSLLAKGLSFSKKNLKKASLSVQELLEENKIVWPSLSSGVQLLMAARFLGKYSKIGQLEPTRDAVMEETFEIQKKYPHLSKNGLRDLFKNMRSILNTAQNNLLAARSASLGVILPFYQVTQSAAEWTPLFSITTLHLNAFESLIEHFKKNKKLFGLAVSLVCGHHGEKQVLHKKIRVMKPHEKFNVVSPYLLPSGTSCHVTECLKVIGTVYDKGLTYPQLQPYLDSLAVVSIDSCKEGIEAFKKFDHLSIKKWIRASAADHPQAFPGHSLEWNKLDASTASRMRGQLEKGVAQAKFLCCPSRGLYPRHDAPYTIGELIAWEKHASK